MFITIPFLFVVSIYFIYATNFIIVNGEVKNTSVLIYLSIINFIPLFYSLLVPIIFKKLSFTKCLYYYISYIFYLLISAPLSLVIFFNSVLKLDVLTWGKTRAVSN